MERKDKEAFAVILLGILTGCRNECDLVMVAMFILTAVLFVRWVKKYVQMH